MSAQKWPRAVPGRENRWDVSRVVFYDERPMHLHLGTPAQELFLMWTYVDLCRTPRATSEIQEWLKGATTCPHGLIDALGRTLFARCFRYFGRGRLVDRYSTRLVDTDVEARKVYTTWSGVEWLDGYKDTVEGLEP